MVLVDRGSGDLSASDSSSDGEDLGWLCVGRNLVSSLVGPVSVEVVFVRGKDRASVGFAEQQDIVGAVVAGSSDPAFREAIRSRLARRGLHYFDAFGAEDRVEGVAEVGSAIADQEPEVGCPRNCSGFGSRCGPVVGWRWLVELGCGAF